MFNILKKKAITFFNQNPVPDVAFRNCLDQKSKRSFFMVLIAHYADQPQEIINVINILKSNNLFEDQDFLNVVWSLSLQTTDTKNIVKKLSTIIAAINSKSIIQKSALMEFLPESIICQSGLMEQQQIDKKTQRIYTKINYQQHKYSLLKQNNQGYAKLLLLLINLTDQYESQEVWSKILALVGNFDLDPDRVLDLIIETKLQKNSVQIYNPLIKKFKKQSITVIVGNRLTKKSPQLSKNLVFGGYVYNFAQTTMEQIYKKDGQILNPALIQLCAQLIKQNIIKLEDLQVYLQPAESALEEINYKRIKHGQQKIMKSFKMSLQEIDQKEKIKQFFEDNLKFMGQLLHSSKLALYCQFLKKNDWNLFKKCWQPYDGKFDLLLYQPIMNNLLSLMEWIIQPIYQKISFSRFFKQKKQSKIFFQKNQNGFHQHSEVTQELFKDLKELFCYIQSYIGFNHSLFFKICRIFKQLIKGNPDLQIRMIQSQLQQSMKFILKNYIIPGICYDKNNPTLGMQAYQVLQKFDYRFRYECYLQVYTHKMTLNPYLANFFQLVKNKQNVIVNNLSKDNKKLFVKKLAKLTHNHALQVLYWVIRRLLMADYQAVVPQIVSALNNCTPLTLEMTIFLMIFYLNEQKQPSVNAKTRQFQPWFKNIITFISLFYRKYLQVDIQPVFDYIIVKIGEPVRQLQDNGQMPGALLKLLHELLNKMFGTFMNQDINKKQFQILATGHRLQSEMLYLTSQIRAAKKSKHILQKFFWTQSVDHHNGYSLAFNLLVLLTQKRAQLIHKSYIDDIKIIGDIFDQYTVLIIQLVRVLTYQSIDFQHYKRLLPNNSLHILLNGFKLPMEIAFQIVRSGVKAIGLMSKQEWLQTTQQISKALDVYVADKDNLIEGHSQNHEKIYQTLNCYKNNFKQIVSIGFFSTFWLLSLDSIYFPAKLYTQKIEDLKKKIQGIGIAKKDRSDRDVEKNKTLYQKILKQEQIQKKKAAVTLTQQNLKKLQIQAYKTNSNIDAFVEVFVQTCLLPRLLLDPKQALYCIKFVIQTIKANKMTSSKSIKFLTLIIEFVSNYLPHSTFRQATNCLSIFLSEILGIFINWNDQAKLKQDLKKYLGIQDIKDNNYIKLKQYILRLFERIGKLIISIKDQPYMIKNCLYLLEKVDAIPGYKQQAEELQVHLKQIKSKFQTQDMQTICDRQIVILSLKKDQLPDKFSQTTTNVTTQPPQQTINVIPAPALQTKSNQPPNFPRVSPIKQLIKNRQEQKTFKKDKSPLPIRQNKQQKFNKKDQKSSSVNNSGDDKYSKKQPASDKPKQDRYQNEDKTKKSVDRNEKERNDKNKVQQQKKNSISNNKNIESARIQSKTIKSQDIKTVPQNQMVPQNNVMTFSNLPTIQESQKQKQAIAPPLRTVKQMKQMQLKRKHSQIANKGQYQPQSQQQTNPDNNTSNKEYYVRDNVEISQPAVEVESSLTQKIERLRAQMLINKRRKQAEQLKRRQIQQQQSLRNNPFSNKLVGSTKQSQSYSSNDRLIDVEQHSHQQFNKISRQKVIEEGQLEQQQSGQVPNQLLVEQSAKPSLKYYSNKQKSNLTINQSDRIVNYQPKEKRKQSQLRQERRANYEKRFTDNIQEQRGSSKHSQERSSMDKERSSIDNRSSQRSSIDSRNSKVKKNRRKQQNTEYLVNSQQRQREREINPSRQKQIDKGSQKARKRQIQRKFGLHEVINLDQQQQVKIKRQKQNQLAQIEEFLQTRRGLSHPENEFRQGQKTRIQRNQRAQQEKLKQGKPLGQLGKNAFERLIKLKQRQQGSQRPQGTQRLQNRPRQITDKLRQNPEQRGGKISLKIRQKHSQIGQISSQQAGQVSGYEGGEVRYSQVSGEEIQREGVQKVQGKIKGSKKIQRKRFQEQRRLEEGQKLREIRYRQTQGQIRKI